MAAAFVPPARMPPLFAGQASHPDPPLPDLAFDESQAPLPSRPPGPVATVFVGNLDTSAEGIEEVLRELFAQAGHVEGLSVPRDKGPGGGYKGFAFVDFCDHRSAEYAVHVLGGLRVGSRNIRVELKGGARAPVPGAAALDSGRGTGVGAYEGMQGPYGEHPRPGLPLAPEPPRTEPRGGGTPTPSGEEGWEPLAPARRASSFGPRDPRPRGYDQPNPYWNMEPPIPSPYGAYPPQQPGPAYGCGGPGPGPGPGAYPQWQAEAAARAARDNFYGGRAPADWEPAGRRRFREEPDDGDARRRIAPRYR